MTRAQQTISIALLFTSLYLAVFMEVVSFPEKVQKEIVPVLPFWAIVSFGAYLLFKLGLGVFTFNDVPDAHKELVEQIQQARAELSAKGVDVGSD
ncbi:dolichol phosphate mannosyltransferas-like protein subunit 3 [Bimuria novae-zelandiae CBS 107.79]|uniref:Dolichol-phosphate mannosyltransferase subunit 3 n=1 Tax=Bimuria novae-zelandiae CBS 107.79 TaxID=1447943 RepID=A0A6A5UUD8_9PLEO|nr:dolichol phosphate mannosyltransferas-like protein subunit 3 [Bimuria novae-zelandiae CBS 107.79]